MVLMVIYCINLCHQALITAPTIMEKIWRFLEKKSLRQLKVSCLQRCLSSCGCPPLNTWTMATIYHIQLKWLNDLKKQELIYFMYQVEEKALQEKTNQKTHLGIKFLLPESLKNN